MKQLITRTLASLVLMVMSVSAISHAQSTTWVVKANIPFEFTVAGKAFPAGEYSLVEPIQHYLVLRDSRGHSVASVFTSGIDSSSLPATSKLRFDSSNGTPALVEVWQQQDSLGQRLILSKSELALAKRTTESRESTEGSQP